MAAKNNASEKALRDIIIQRMLQSPKALKAAAAAGTEGAQPGGNAGLCMIRLFLFAFSL